MIQIILHKNAIAEGDYDIDILYHESYYHAVGKLICLHFTSPATR